ncbi:uncharacterized transmembrane protein DDB_G0289901-like [Musca domestica]|uniref:Uncharacterized transmembrane protein DDB_G0289901-like n=1 Tax=Musca domestica TaxID=7370 RepID=A0ABM3UVX1_MUSDO|nr:uncharacterized transmembrane protein DDB_G0289901-like [Musca domestica]
MKLFVGATLAIMLGIMGQVTRAQNLANGAIPSNLMANLVNGAGGATKWSFSTNSGPASSGISSSADAAASLGSALPANLMGDLSKIMAQAGNAGNGKFSFTTTSGSSSGNQDGVAATAAVLPGNLVGDLSQMFGQNVDLNKIISQSGSGSGGSGKWSFSVNGSPTTMTSSSTSSSGGQILNSGAANLVGDLSQMFGQAGSGGNVKWSVNGSPTTMTSTSSSSSAGVQGQGSGVGMAIPGQLMGDLSQMFGKGGSGGSTKWSVNVNGGPSMTSGIQTHDLASHLAGGISGGINVGGHPITGSTTVSSGTGGKIGTAGRWKVSVNNGPASVSKVPINNAIHGNLVGQGFTPQVTTSTTTTTTGNMGSLQNNLASMFGQISAGGGSGGSIQNDLASMFGQVGAGAGSGGSVQNDLASMFGQMGAAGGSSGKLTVSVNPSITTSITTSTSGSSSSSSTTPVGGLQGNLIVGSTGTSGTTTGGSKGKWSVTINTGPASGILGAVQGIATGSSTLSGGSSGQVNIGSTTSGGSTTGHLNINMGSTGSAGQTSSDANGQWTIETSGTTNDGDLSGHLTIGTSGTTTTELPPANQMMEV